jgi:tRNA nucleotidyltransferase (CCA-adding enzyme)
MIYKNLNLTLSHEYKTGVDHITNTLKSAGYECYMVGGAVRDMVLGLPAYDIDLATNARPNQITALFNHVIPTGIKHGTVTVLLKKQPFEITTYRSDGKYIDGRRPEEVYFSDTLEEDIIRRDFTINGLAYNTHTNELIDLVDGVNDIKAKIIRTIHNPMDRLSEDGLRSYRACRFAAKLGFEIHEETLEAMSQTVQISAKVSVERVRDEIIKMMSAEKPSIGIEYLRKTGLLKLCLPELDAAYEVTQNKYHAFDVYHHCIYACDAAAAHDPILRFATLLHDIGKVPCRGIGEDGDYTFYNHEIVGSRMLKILMKRLKFSNDEIQRATHLVKNHMFYYTPDWSDGAVRRFVRKVGEENLTDLLKLRAADREGNGSRKGLSQPVFELQKRITKVQEEDSAFSVRDLKINGREIMNELEIGEGRLIGEILNQLLELVLDAPELNSRDSLLEEARKYINSL